MTDSRYIHEEYTHDLTSPNEIVPLLAEVFKPASVADIGCGIGTFLYCFKKQGIKDVLGVDGSWADKQLVSKYLAPDEFMECNLEESFNLQRTFDLVLCLEVAEHLLPQQADQLVSNLARLSKIIVFSAAIPDQGGQNHINEQPVEYWQEKFRQHNYYFLDILRPFFWENNKVHWWYRQNMFVVMHESLRQHDFKFPAPQPGKILNYVHPQLLRTKQAEIDNIKAGKFPVSSYLAYLYRGLFRKKKP